MRSIALVNTTRQSSSTPCKHLNISRGLGDRAGEGTAYGNLGNDFNGLGQHATRRSSSSPRILTLSVSRGTGLRKNMSKETWRLHNNAGHRSQSRDQDIFNQSKIMKSIRGSWYFFLIFNLGRGLRYVDSQLTSDTAWNCASSFVFIGAFGRNILWYLYKVINLTAINEQ